VAIRLRSGCYYFLTAPFFGNFSNWQYGTQLAKEGFESEFTAFEKLASLLAPFKERRDGLSVVLEIVQIK